MMILFASLLVAGEPQGLKLLTGEELKATVVGSRISYGGREGDESFGPGGAYTVFNRAPLAGTYVVTGDQVCVTLSGTRRCWRLLRNQEGGHVMDFALPGGQHALQRVLIRPGD
ncbi:hypothetical protein DDF62_06810 [Caulobacter radicis]|uniref:hypothetical protein n=1 Tax=Caulobacter radicis TaxID=2172650 RepID=UPI000D573A10|nr:hypothetical protein [Caulobacter radicis]PVM91730.1 hypothetical protein DDF62_06810 [Caulobacter radicis]